MAWSELGNGPLCSGRRRRLTLDVSEARHAKSLLQAVRFAPVGHKYDGWTEDDHDLFRELLKVAGRESVPDESGTATNADTEED